MVPAMARKLVNPTAAAQIREMVRKTTNERDTASGRISMTDGRNFQFAAVPLHVLCFWPRDHRRLHALQKERVLGH